MEDLYESSVITRKMHHHCYLCECVLDFGPIHSFCCFSFERYNGILGGFHVNNHQIEVQVMREFIERQQLGSMSLPGEFHRCKDKLATAEKESLALTKTCFTPNT